MTVKKRTSRLRKLLDNDKRFQDQHFDLIYKELKRLASRERRRNPLASINTTALAHEAWVKLEESLSLEFKSQEHYYAIAACAMRQILVDDVRRRFAKRRGGPGSVQNTVVFDENAENQAVQALWAVDTELLALDAALNELGKINARQVEIVECKFFFGLSRAETAAVLGISESSIDRDWRFAKAFLSDAIRPENKTR